MASQQTAVDAVYSVVLTDILSMQAEVSQQYQEQ